MTDAFAHPSRGEPLDATPDVETVAAIDIGTNSVHLLVARLVGHGRFEVIASEKEMARLGSGDARMKVLEDAAMDRGVDALRRFRQVAEVSAATIKAVATSAVREAENQEEFLRRAWAEAEVKVDVISGVEEARLIHLGAINAVPVGQRRALVVDIGGGSTELVIGPAGRPVLTRSEKVGALRLTQQFFADNKVTAKRVKECRRFLQSFLQQAKVEIADYGFDLAIGSSGTIQNLASMAAQRRGEALRSINNVGFTASELSEVTEDLVGARDLDERAQLPGLDPRRADIIVAGAVLLQEIFRALDIERMVVSEFALREGLLLDQHQEYRGDAFHHLTDLRRSSVDHVADLFDPDRAHAEHTTDLALEIFAQTRELHDLGEEAIDYLEAGGLLHNVGRFIAHSAHHKHSYYVIRNTDQLTGFTDREIELIAQIARYHRRSGPKTKHLAYASLSESDQHIVVILAGILRIAIGLDRSHVGAVRDVQCEVDGKELTIRADVTSGADVALDLYAADQGRQLLERALDITVSVTLA